MRPVDNKPVMNRPVMKRPVKNRPVMNRPVMNNSSLELTCFLVIGNSAVLTSNVSSMMDQP